MLRRLMTVVCALACGLACGQTTITADGSTTMGPIVKAFAEYYMSLHPDVNITVSESGSGNGAKAIINGTADIGNLSRRMKDEEREAARQKGVEVVERVIAMDGLAVVVHPSNPVNELTLDQLRAIYAGGIANWQELGGPDLKIVVISRDTNSGTYETFQSLVMKNERVTERAEYVGSNGAARQRVLSTPAAIAYVGLAFTEGLKPLAIEGVMPSAETIIEGRYPLARPLYMYTNGEPAPGTHLANFVNLYKTEVGKEIIREQGFVPLP